MATFSALMTMTKSPPSTLGVNVGLCLPRSSLAASTASRPSTTSVASMTYHERVVSPAFGVYVGTALPLLFGWIPVTRVPVRRGGGDPSATDFDPRPRHTARQPRSLPADVIAGQNAFSRAWIVPDLGRSDGSPRQRRRPTTTRLSKR